MTNRTAVVAEYIELAKNEDIEGATNYLKECFMKEDGVTMDEDALQSFIEEVTKAAAIDATADMVEVSEETTDDAATEVQEATTDSEATN